MTRPFKRAKKCSTTTLLHYGLLVYFVTYKHPCRALTSVPMNNYWPASTQNAKTSAWRFITIHLLSFTEDLEQTSGHWRKDESNGAWHPPVEPSSCGGANVRNLGGQKKHIFLPSACEVESLVGERWCDCVFVHNFVRSKIHFSYLNHDRF